MRTLVIDCATEACSVALLDGSGRIAGDFRILGRGHAEQLVPMIAALPGRGRADQIAVAMGPGSFTGVRVGLAAAKALALAWNAELTGYPTLALVAAMAQLGRAPAPLAVVTTGGHGEWFVQRFSDDGLASCDVTSLKPGDAASIIGEALIVGSQAEAFVGLRGYGEALPILPDASSFPLLVPSALTGIVRPLYGRAPDARLPGAAA